MACSPVSQRHSVRLVSCDGAQGKCGKGRLGEAWSTLETTCESLHSANPAEGPDKEVAELISSSLKRREKNTWGMNKSICIFYFLNIADQGV